LPKRTGKKIYVTCFELEKSTGENEKKDSNLCSRNFNWMLTQASTLNKKKLEKYCSPKSEITNQAQDLLSEAMWGQTNQQTNQQINQQTNQRTKRVIEALARA
jgi:hypothetical protein